MASIEVRAKKGDEEAIVSYDFGDNLADSVERFGEQVVFTNFRQAAKITLQAGMRRCLENRKDPAEFAKAFRPGVMTAVRAADPVIAFKAKFSSMGEEEKKALMEELLGSME